MTAPERFSEERYHLEYLGIQEAIRHFTQHQILDQCYLYLRNPVLGNLPDLRRKSWLVFLLIKWTFLQEGPWQNEKLDAPRLEKLLLRLHDLVNLTRSPNQHENIFFFFRAHLFQQDIFQKNFSTNDIARQLLLFNEIESNSIIRRSFLELTGIATATFFDFAFMVAGHAVIEEMEPLNVIWFSTLNQHYPAEDARKFLDTISVPLDEITRRLTPHAANMGHSSEYFEQTPFIHFPLIRIPDEGDGYYVYLNQNILFRGLEHFAFDFY